MAGPRTPTAPGQVRPARPTRAKRAAQAPAIETLPLPRIEAVEATAAAAAAAAAAKAVSADRRRRCGSPVADGSSRVAAWAHGIASAVGHAVQTAVACAMAWASSSSPSPSPSPEHGVVARMDAAPLLTARLLSSSAAVVSSSALAARLWRHGCFGRGEWSRGVPDWHAARARQAAEGSTSPAAVARRRPGKPATAAAAAAGSPSLLDGLVENHVLSAPETFFLAWGLGALAVVRDYGAPALSLSQLWRALFTVPETGALRVDALAGYLVYHHFRARGWVVRSGQTFGVPFALYTHGPVFGHATHVVQYETVITTQDARGIERRDATWVEDSRVEYMPTDASWYDVLTHARVSSQVKKRLLWVRLSLPGDLLRETLEVLEQTRDVDGVLPMSLMQQWFVLPRLAQVQVTRWNPDRTR
ncbi:hypothetical protein CXG81DRAFT_17631 [Caulochytrium protostelioides]|uniref:tRNA-intron lyase n=1 Tax=Caulochytrium protostelioides TaxID=1555241 RepID=A0A4P9XBF4_9FUNG|nr:hypothetical protein CXG81DRAFT_17631 [Caulochytrium protostelioides]|eukprot:RKP02747.1 hypothetical protein CXG81DRAFT_17631 [Caulochytrium protostelioides]